MRLLQFKAIKLCLVLIIGILCGSLLNTSIYQALIPVGVFFILLVVLLFKAHKNGVLFGATAYFLTICIGNLAVSLNNPTNYSTYYANYTKQENQQWHLIISDVLKKNTYSQRYYAKVVTLDSSIASGEILVDIALDSTTTNLQVDDEIIAVGAANSINPPLNPHQFNYKKYLENLGINGQIKLKSNAYIMLPKSIWTFKGFAASVREKIILKLTLAGFGNDELAVMQALLLGQRDNISPETYTNYKNAGAIHILAVSGLHIGVLLLILQFALSWLEYLPHGKIIKLVAVVCLLWAFAFLAGLSASIIRAVTMFSFVAYALYLNRPTNSFNILALSMLFILLVFNPKLIFQVGFQMSYAAVIAIFWVYPILQKLWWPKNWILQKAWQLVSVSIAAQLGVLPISLFYFHQFPGLFFISNLLIIPALEVILGGGILVIILALLNALPNWLTESYNYIIYLMNQIIGWVAQQEAFIFKSISFDWIQLILAFAIIYFLVELLQKTTIKKALPLACAIIGFQLYVLFIAYKTNQKEVLLLAHQTKNTILLHQGGSALTVATIDTLRTNTLENDYAIAEFIQTISHQPLKNSYEFNDHSILLIDSTGVYPKIVKDLDYLILTQSPKINLDRVLDAIKPKNIIVDGSNYTSYILRWKKTCTKRKLPFHYTGEKGAYYFE